MKIKDFLLKTWRLYKKYFIPLILIYLLISVRDNYIERPSGFWSVAVRVFILHIFGTAISCYIIKLWKDEKGQIRNFIQPFTEPQYRLKIWVMFALSTVFTMSGVFAAKSLLMNIGTINTFTQLLFVISIYGVYKLFVSVIDQIIEIIITVFILYPQGSPFKTFIKGLEYNVRYLIPYCILDFVVMIIPKQIANILIPYMDVIFIALIVSPLVGFGILVQAGFLYEKITFKENSKVYSNTIDTYKDIDNLYKRYGYKLILICIMMFIAAITIICSTSFIAAILFIVIAEPLIIRLVLKKHIEKLDKILYDDCDPIKYLDLIEYATKEKKNFFYNYLYKTLYSRLFTVNIVLEKYDVVEQLLEKEKKNSANYKIFKSNCELSKAITENNTEKYIYIYELAPKILKKFKTYQCRYLIAKGKRQEAFELITSYTETRKYNEIIRQKVLADYYIDDGNIEQAKNCMKFIAYNANKLPVQKTAEKWLEDNK